MFANFYKLNQQMDANDTILAMMAITVLVPVLFIFVIIMNACDAFRLPEVRQQVYRVESL